MNLWHFDRDLYEPGRSFDVVDSPFGRIGLLICADARLPEIARVLSVMGADLIIDPANLTGYSFSPKGLTNPVSYTHLDVYKRQRPAPPRRSFPLPEPSA